MRQLEIKIPFLEAMEQMPLYAKYLKTLLGNKKKLESKVVNLSEKVSAIILGTWLRKKRLEDPLCF